MVEFDLWCWKVFVIVCVVFFMIVFDVWICLFVFEWLVRYVEEDELCCVFNFGIGWCVVVFDLVLGEIVIGWIV